MTKLQLFNAVKSFGNKKVVQEVAFQLNSGEILGFFGRNGSGKSTLLQLLFGSIQANQLSMSINGRKITPSEVIQKQLIAYCPQHGFLPKNIRVRDVIPVFHPSEEKQDAVFYDAHIATLTHKNIGSLSSGELKYLEVLLIGHLPHPFLLLDEPFSMVEPLHKEQLKAFLKQKKQHKGIIVTDHYYDDVLAISDKNMVIKDGVCHTIHGKAELEKFEYLRQS